MVLTCSCSNTCADVQHAFCCAGHAAQCPLSNSAHRGPALSLPHAVKLHALQDMKTAIKHLITLLPEYALVGLVSYGMHVSVQELGYQALPKSYLLDGQRELSAADVRTSCLPWAKCPFVQ